MPQGDESTKLGCMPHIQIQTKAAAGADHSSRSLGLNSHSESDGDCATSRSACATPPCNTDKVHHATPVNWRKRKYGPSFSHNREGTGETKRLDQQRDVLLGGQEPLSLSLEMDKSEGLLRTTWCGFCGLRKRFSSSSDGVDSLWCRCGVQEESGEDQLQYKWKSLEGFLPKVLDNADGIALERSASTDTLQRSQEQPPDVIQAAYVSNTELTMSGDYLAQEDNFSVECLAMMERVMEEQEPANKSLQEHIEF